MSVYVVSDAGVVYELWAETGALVSSTGTAQAGRTPIGAPVGFPASVSLDSVGNVLIGGCYNNSRVSGLGQLRTECVYQSPGRWSVPSDTIPGYDAETGFDPAVHTGSVTKAGSIVSSAASGASYIVFTRFQGAVAPSARVQVVVAFNTTTGAALWSMGFPLASVWGDGSGDQVPFGDTGVALGSDGTLYFASLDGRVYALRDCAPGTGDAPYDAGTLQGPFRCGSCPTQTYNDGTFRQCQLCAAGNSTSSK
jgi:outer membrane protein assembly factor BamB